MIEHTSLKNVCFALCNEIQDCLEFWIPCHGFWDADSLSVELRFRILIVNESPDSFFPEEKFPNSLTWGDMLIQTFI